MQHEPSMSINELSEFNFFSTIGNKIMLLRKEKGIDQESLAINIGLSRSSIINIEKGRQRPSVFQLWLMARYLGVTISDLIPPLNLPDIIGDWKERIETNEGIQGDGQKKLTAEFIAATIPK